MADDNKPSKQDQAEAQAQGEAKQKQEAERKEAQAKSEGTKTGADGNKAQGAQSTAQGNSSDSIEGQAAENSGQKFLGEADVRTLRHDAGLDQLAGHEANVLAWQESDAGQAFLADEKDRQKEIKEEGKRLSELTNKDNLDEGAAKYVEVVKGK